MAQRVAIGIIWRPQSIAYPVEQDQWLTGEMPAHESWGVSQSTTVQTCFIVSVLFEKTVYVVVVFKSDALLHLSSPLTPAPPHTHSSHSDGE